MTSVSVGGMAGLSSAGRVLVARLTGVAARFASGQQARVHAEFGDQEPVGDVAAVAALREVTADVWLLTAAAAMYVDSGDWYAAEALRLLVLAGADPDGAAQWRRDHPPRSFQAPQH